MSDRVRELAEREAALLLRSAAQRRAFAAEVHGIQARLHTVDRATAVARGALLHPVVIFGGLVALLVPFAWVLEQLLAARLFNPMVTVGRSSLFVYWIHVEMVYGIVALPLRNHLPLGRALLGTALLILLLYVIVIVKNRLLERYELRGPLRLLAPVVR